MVVLAKMGRESSELLNTWHFKSTFVLTSNPIQYGSNPQSISITTIYLCHLRPTDDLNDSIAYLFVERQAKLGKISNKGYQNVSHVIL